MKNEIFRVIRILISINIFCLLMVNESLCFDINIGWKINNINSPAPGNLIFDWVTTSHFFLVDHYGTPVQVVPLNNASKPVKYLDNGNWILFNKDKYYIMNKEYNMIDSFPHPTNLDVDFHDVLYLSNGNLMILCTEERIVDLSQIIEGGKSDATVIGNVLAEINNSGSIVWSWYALDNFKITDATEDVDLTQSRIDFSHANCMFLDYDGNLIVSFRHLDEITKINRQNGQIIWRFGGSKCKNNQFVIENDNNGGFIGFTHQHSVSTLPNGNILMYDNGNLRSPQFSRAVEYQMDYTNKIAKKVWEYRNTPDFYSYMFGSAYRLPNGNTLINWGYNRISEIKSDKSIAMELVFDNSSHSSYRAFKVTFNLPVVKRYISSGSEYDFNEYDNQTGVKLLINSMNSSGNLSVEYHNYQPARTAFSDTNFTEIFPVRWVLRKEFSGSFQGKFKLNSSFLKILTDPTKISFFKRNKETEGNFEQLQTTFNEFTNELSCDLSDEGEIILVNHKLNDIELSKPFNNSMNINPNSALEWINNTGAEKYQVQLSQNPDFNNTILSETTIYNEFHLGNTTLENDTKYYWRVRAMNLKDTTKWSDIFNFTTIKSSIPSLSYPANNSLAIKTNDSLKWKQFYNGYNYIVQISETNNFSKIILSNDVKNNCFYIFNFLKNDTKYYWRVKAYTENDSTKWSDVFSFTTVLVSPTLISPLDHEINVSPQAKLLFSPNNINQNYEIEISTDYNFSNILIRDSIKTLSHDYMTNLEYYKDYYWRIRAYDDKNNFSQFTTPWKFTTLLQSPTLLSPVNKSQNISVLSSFNWEKSDSAKSYLIEISLDFDFENVIYNEIIDDEDYFQPSDLPFETELYWRVQSKNGLNKSSWSDVFSFKSGNRIKPVNPNILFPYNHSVYLTKGILEFEIDKNIASSQIQISTDSNFKKIILDTIVKTAKYFFSGLIYETNYYWRVKSYRNFDSSDWSNTSSFFTNNKNNKVYLLSPSNEQFQVPLKTNLIWMRNADADKYRLQISSDINFSDIYIDSNITGECKYYADWLIENKKYYWRVRYYNKDTESYWSDIWQFNTVDPNSIQSPDLLSPADKQNSMPINLTLKWLQIDGAEVYEIAFSTDKNFYHDVKKFTSIDSEIEIKELNYNTRYFWRVAALKNNSRSAWSEVYEFLTILKSPNKLIPNLGELVAAKGNLQWDNSDEGVSFRLQISSDSEFYTILTDSSDIIINTYTYNLAPKNEYYWRIKKYKSDNSSEWSETAFFLTSDPSSVDNNAISNIDLIYPQPAKDIIQLNDLNANFQPFKILDVIGNLKSEGIYNNFINIKDLTKGVYFLQINDRNYKFFK